MDWKRSVVPWTDSDCCHWKWSVVPWTDDDDCHWKRSWHGTLNATNTLLLAIDKKMLIMTVSVASWYGTFNKATNILFLARYTRMPEMTMSVESWSETLNNAANILLLARNNKMLIMTTSVASHQTTHKNAMQWNGSFTEKMMIVLALPQLLRTKGRWWHLQRALAVWTPKNWRPTAFCSSTAQRWCGRGGRLSSQYLFCLVFRTVPSCR